MLTYNFANRILNLMGAKINNISMNGVVRVGLSSTAPDRDGTGFTEPGEETGYERVLLGDTAQSLSQLMGSAVEGVITNTKNIFFPKAIIDYDDTITHFLIFIGTELVAFEELKTPIKPWENTVPIVEVGNLELTLE